MLKEKCCHPQYAEDNGRCTLCEEPILKTTKPKTASVSVRQQVGRALRQPVSNLYLNRYARRNW